MFKFFSRQESALIPLILLIIASLACHQPAKDNDRGFGQRTPEPEGSPIESNTPSEITVSERKAANNKEKPEMTNKNEETAVSGFRNNVDQNLRRNQMTLDSVARISDAVEGRIYKEYGAILLTKAKPPSKMMFTSDAEVKSFQSSASAGRATIGGAPVELQSLALDALQRAIAEAKSNGLSITPRDGAEASKRSYGKTLELWNSRFEPALKHWQQKGRLDAAEVSRLRSLPIKEQVAAVLEVEKRGIYFNTFFNNSILYSVAAPGTSQHLSMLAFDVKEFANKRVQRILGKHGWFRTVQNDAPHFTYIGYQESELPGLGLKKVTKKDGDFWVPDV